MKYSEVLTKIALDSADMNNVLSNPQVQTALSDYYENGAGQKYKNSVSPQEIMRIALGATAGGGAGWLLSRLLHKKPKAWRTALYTLGGATVGGLGTHWYINKKDRFGHSIASKDRRDAMLASPEAQRMITTIHEAGKNIDDTNKNNGHSDAHFAGLNFDGQGLLAGGSGAAGSSILGGLVTRAVANGADSRKLTRTRNLMTALNNADMDKAFTLKGAKSQVESLPPLRRNGAAPIVFDSKAPRGQRFSVPTEYSDALNPKGRKLISLRGGLASTIPGFILANGWDSYRRHSAFDAAQAQQEEALRLFTSGK